MTGAVLVSPDGGLRPEALAGIASANEASVTVVAALGVRGVAQSSLLNLVAERDAFETSRRPGEQKSLGIHTTIVDGDTSALQMRLPRQLVLLDVEGFDGIDRTREERRDRAASLAVSVCDMVLFSIRMNDLNRVASNGVSALRVNLTEMFKFQDAGIIPMPSGKKAFVVVIRDYDAEMLAREEVINGFLQEMQEMYESVSKPSRCPARIADIFEFEFITLPCAFLAKAAFDDAVAGFRERLKDPFNDDYLFEDGAYARAQGGNASLSDVCAKVWNALDEETTRDMPASKELMATFGCDNTMRKVFEKYKRVVRDWKHEADDGNVIDGFGDAATTLLEETLTVYDQDAGPHRGSKAFQRKRDELKENLDADLYNLFAKQTLKLREISYNLFKEKIEDISLDDSDLEKLVNKYLKDAQKHFTESATKLRPRGSSWRFDNESKELASHMREDATERLQQARLEDYSNGQRGRRGRRGQRGPRAPGTRPRQPISLSFHYLDPAPFGWKDSRYEKLNADDNLEYNRGSNSSGGPPEQGLTVPLLPGKDEAWDRNFIHREK
jgi:predicted RNA-binding Zn ribbon-like protein